MSFVALLYGFLLFSLSFFLFLYAFSTNNHQGPIVCKGTLFSPFVFPKIHSLMITIGSPSPKGNSATPPTKQVIGERCFRSDLTQGSVGKGSEG